MGEIDRILPLASVNYGGRWTLTIAHAVVDSRMDYCNTVLAGAPRTVTDSLQRVLNAAARVITGTRKFDCGLGQYIMRPILHDQLVNALHGSTFPTGFSSKASDSSPVSERPRTTVSVLEHCIPVSSADARRHLRSANRHLLAVPRFPLNTYGRRAFSVAGPLAWNSLSVGYYFIFYPRSNE